jgi:hypothetical protein
VKLRALPIVLVLLAAACSGGNPGTDSGEGPFATVASSDLAVGEDRLLVLLRDIDGTPIGGPNLPATLKVTSEGGSDAPVGSAGFVWMIPDVIGLYRAPVTLPLAGLWSVDVEIDGYQIAPASFIVKEAANTPVPGERAPVAASPTMAERPLSELTTDPEPDPHFYRLSLGEAVTNGRPTVVVFATPAYCTSGACGPMLDQMKEIADDWPGVDWVHVEVYDLEAPPHEHDLSEPVDHVHDIELVPVAAVQAWGLATEPWLFVVDAEGMVAARFEGAVATEEVEEVLAGFPPP